MSPDLDLPGACLRRAREEAGLSLAGLARRMAASWETVRRAERERDPRLSTLRRHLEAMPFLSPADILGLGAPSSPSSPLAAQGAWLLHRDLQGHVATRVVHQVEILAGEARRVTQTWSGVRGLSLDLRDAVQRTNVLRAVVHAPTSVLRDLVSTPQDEQGGTRRFEAGGTTHELTFGRPLARHGFTYRRQWMQQRQPVDPALRDEVAPEDPAVETVGFDVDASMEALELRLVLAAGSKPPLVARYAASEMVVPSCGAFAMATDLHPRGLDAAWHAGTGTLVLRIRRPQPHVRYGLAWIANETERRAFAVPRRARASGAGAAAAALRSAREAAGLSVRETARRAGVSPATLLAAESGFDARRSTLRRCLHALPALRAAALFEVARARDPLSPLEAWLYQREVAGVVAREAERSVEVNASGDARETITLRGLRRIAPSPRDLVVKDAISRAQAGRVGAVLVDADDPSAPGPSLRIRWHRLPGEQEEFHLVIPAALADSGASFTRRERKTAAYKVRSDQVGRSIGPAFECPYPAERLILSVRLPRAVRPAEIRAFARAAVAVTNPRWPDLAAQVHPTGFRFEWAEDERLARLVVERPLMGLRYSIAWRMA